MTFVFFQVLLNVDNLLTGSSDLEFSDLNDEDYVPETSDDSNDSFIPVATAVFNPKDKAKDFESEARVQFEPLTSFTGLCSNETSKKKLDKKHYCVYCEKPQSKLKRHLSTIHREEAEVLRMLTANPKKFVKIKHAGDHKHNLQALKDGHGDLVVKKRRISSKASADDFVPCPKCLGYFYHRDLWRHKCCDDSIANKRK